MTKLKLILATIFIIKLINNSQIFQNENYQKKKDKKIKHKIILIKSKKGKICYCPFIIDPVCAKDKKYNNSCVAKCERIFNAESSKNKIKESLNYEKIFGLKQSEKKKKKKNFKLLNSTIEQIYKKKIINPNFNEKYIKKKIIETINKEKFNKKMIHPNLKENEIIEVIKPILNEKERINKFIEPIFKEKKQIIEQNLEKRPIEYIKTILKVDLNQKEKQILKKDKSKEQQIYKEEQSSKKKIKQIFKKRRSLLKKEQQLLKEEESLIKKEQLLKEEGSLIKKEPQLFKKGESLIKKEQQNPFALYTAANFFSISRFRKKNYQRLLELHKLSSSLKIKNWENKNEEPIDLEKFFLNSPVKTIIHKIRCRCNGKIKPVCINGRKFDNDCFARCENVYTAVDCLIKKKKYKPKSICRCNGKKFKPVCSNGRKFDNSCLAKCAGVYNTVRCGLRDSRPNNIEN